MIWHKTLEPYCRRSSTQLPQRRRNPLSWQFHHRRTRPHLVLVAGGRYLGVKQRNGRTRQTYTVRAALTLGSSEGLDGLTSPAAQAANAFRMQKQGSVHISSSTTFHDLWHGGKGKEAGLAFERAAKIQTDNLVRIKYFVYKMGLDVYFLSERARWRGEYPPGGL